MYQYQLELPAEPLCGARYLKQLAPKLERLHEVGTARDKAHNRDFFFDQYVALLHGCQTDQVEWPDSDK